MQLYTFKKLILSSSIIAIICSSQTFAAKFETPGANTSGSDSVAIGERASAANGNAGISMGFFAQADGSNATAIGGGTNNLVGASANGASAIAIGGGIRDDNDSTKEKAASSAVGEAAIALGQAANSTGNNVALGSGSTAVDPTLTPVLSYLTQKTTTSVVSVGSSDNSLYRRITNVADGADAQDVVTVNQLKLVDQKAAAAHTILGSQYDPMTDTWQAAFTYRDSQGDVQTANTVVCRIEFDDRTITTRFRNRCCNDCWN